MKARISRVLIITLMTSLIGCSNMNASGTDSTKAYIGLFSGALIGGLAGNAVHDNGGGRYNYIAVGALLGALIGGSLGMILGEKDHAQYQAAEAASGNGRPMDQPGQIKSKKVSTTGATLTTKTPAKNAGLNEKLLSFWNNLPSTQWFFDDGKQAVG